MAIFSMTDAYVMVNNVDLSDHVKSVKMTYKSDMLDATVMGLAGSTTKTMVGGLKDWNFVVDFLQDFAAGEVDATLFPLVGTTFTIKVKPVNAATSATNPLFYGTAILEGYSPLDGAVTELSKTSVTFSAAGTLTRATADP